MAEIINLRNARKQLARTRKEQKAAENRALSGKKKSERQKEAAERALEAARLDGHKREDE